MGKMMKTVLNKLRRDETGQAFILVLILLVLGALIIAPLLGFMSTGLIAGQLNEKRMSELYAADAGIEDAIWKIMNGLVPAEYDLVVNGKNVHVTVPPDGEDAMISFFANIGVLAGTQGDYNKAKPQAEWLMVYNPIESPTTPGTYDSYRITGFYTSTQKRDILTVGFWIHHYTATEVDWITWDDTVGVDNHLVMDLNLDGDMIDVFDIDEDGTMDIDEANIITKPLVEGYTPVTYRAAEEPLDSEAFIWEWSNNKGPVFGVKAESNQDVFCRTQRFTLDPPIVLSEGEEFPLNVAFLETKQNSIQISWSGEITGMEGILSVATDPTTGKQTTIRSYVFVQEIPDEPGDISILSWEVNLT